ncbi:MAG: hypothetical protein ACXAEU_13745 [Candidatus Hodarchaeales archaeon]|jgi:hypothetical protein
MGDIHIRNVYFVGPDINGQIPFEMLWTMRELFLIGRWQEIEKDAHAAWTSVSNVLLELADFAVDDAVQNVITSATGGFTSDMAGGFISLYASIDSNRSLYRIANVIDSNTLAVDGATRLTAWTDETGISGKIHNGGSGARLDTTAYFVMQAPAGSGRSLQVHFDTSVLTKIEARAYPKGDYTTSATATADVVSTFSNYTDVFRINAYFPDDAATDYYAMIYAFMGYSNDWQTWIFGELSDAAVGDDYPGFISYSLGWNFFEDDAELYMLNETDSQVIFYPTFYKYKSDLNATTHKRLTQALVRKINGGKVKQVQPLVLGEDSAGGGFQRGITPHSFCHVDIADDQFGSDFWKIAEHSLVPRNGVNDSAPMGYAAQ